MQSMLNPERVIALEDALEARVRSVRNLGGDSNHVALVETERNVAFVKWTDRPLRRPFEAEAAGLDAMRAADTGLVIPRVLAFGDIGPGRSFLALEHLESGRRRSDYDELLGRGLATLHRATSALGFGFHVDGTCGSTLQENGFLSSWVEFFRERRLRHQIRLAHERGMSRESIMVLETLADRIHRLIDDELPPSLIHGDLWSGNVMVAKDGRPALVDPAAYYADRAMEFGMMNLFGGFSVRVHAAYRESWPLRAGDEHRIDAYTLFHVLNHFALFGGSYGAEAVALARRILNR